SAAFVRLPLQLARTRLMKRFSNSRIASSNWTPRPTISSTSFSRRSLIMLCSRGWPLLFELAAGQAAERLQILRPRSLDVVLGQRRDWRLLVPTDVLEVIAHDLLIETRLRPSGPVAVSLPESR